VSHMFFNVYPIKHPEVMIGDAAERFEAGELRGCFIRGANGLRSRRKNIAWGTRHRNRVQAIYESRLPQLLSLR